MACVTIVSTTGTASPTKAGRTITRVVKLGEEERIEEIARMLGGSRVTASAREHAHALVAEAKTPARKSGPARAGRRAPANQ